MTSVIAGLVLGLASSVHCAAMCGPLVLLSGARRDGSSRPSPAWQRVMTYHAGRAATYVLIGLLAGAAGDAVAGAGFGRLLAVGAGVLLLVHVLGLVPAGPVGIASRALNGVTLRLARVTRQWGFDTPLVHGALHGLLPCGVLYLAAAAAAGFGDVTQAALFMAGFAIGTTPILATVALAAHTVGRRLPAPVRRAAPVAVALVGILLVARGMGMVPAGHAGHGTTEPTVAPEHVSHGAHRSRTP